MKVQITQAGVYDAKGKMIPVGTEVTVAGDKIPAWLVNKGQVVAEKSGKAVPVTNPAPTEPAA